MVQNLWPAVLGDLGRVLLVCVAEGTAQTNNFCLEVSKHESFQYLILQGHSMTKLALAYYSIR
jgi:hypothetical protein